MSEQESGGRAPGMIARRPVHRGRIVDLGIDTVRFPDGSTGELEMIRHSGAAAVLPVLDGDGAEDPRVVLVRQYRYASGGYLYEVPAGRPDKRADPEWRLKLFDAATERQRRRQSSRPARRRRRSRRRVRQLHPATGAHSRGLGVQVFQLLVTTW